MWDLAVGGQNWVDGTIVGHFKAIDSFAGKILAVIFATAGADSSDDTLSSHGMMAVACADGTLQVVDMADYTVSYSLSFARTADSMHQPWAGNRSQTGHNFLAAFSVCGAWLATAGLTTCVEIQIWDAETGALTASFVSSGNAVKVVKWSLYKGSRQALVIGDAAGDCSFHVWEYNCSKGAEVE